MMEDFSSDVGYVLEFLLGSMTWFCSLVASGIYKLFYLLFDIFITPIKDVCNSNLTGIGSDFFDFLFDKADSFSLNFNIIYWAIGFSLFFFCFRRVVLPLCHTIIDKIASLITPGA